MKALHGLTLEFRQVYADGKGAHAVRRFEIWTPDGKEIGIARRRFEETLAKQPGAVVLVPVYEVEVHGAHVTLKGTDAWCMARAWAEGVHQSHAAALLEALKGLVEAIQYTPLGVGPLVHLEIARRTMAKAGRAPA